MHYTNPSELVKLSSALGVLGFSMDCFPEYSTVKRRYNQLLTSDEGGHRMGRLVFCSAWQTVREHLDLEAVQLKILNVADFIYCPMVNDFIELVDTLRTKEFGGEQGSALRQVFDTVVSYETGRWLDFSRKLEEFEKCTLPEARKLVSQLFYEMNRLDQVFDDLRHMLFHTCRILSNGRIVPRRSNAVIVFRHWHEARKKDDMTDLRQLSQQAFGEKMTE